MNLPVKWKKSLGESGGVSSCHIVVGGHGGLQGAPLTEQQAVVPDSVAREIPKGPLPRDQHTVMKPKAARRIVLIKMTSGELSDILQEEED